MVKRKKNNALNEDDDSFIDPSSKGLIYDEIDDFHDKVEDYDMYDDASDDEASKEQVLGLEEYADDDDDDLMENDIVSSNESNADDQDDERAMGKKKKDYFGTDLTDQRLHNASRFKNKRKGTASASLDLEMGGVKLIQERKKKSNIRQGRLSNQLFTITSKINALPKLDIDIELNREPSLSPSKASKKLKSSSKKSPILFDFEAKIDELSTTLSPLMEAKKKGLLSFNSATQYLQTRYLLCLNYLNVVSAYMMVKSSGANMCGHPVEARLAQYQHLFVELEPCERKYNGELATLLSDLNSGKLEVMKKTKKQRRILGVVRAAEVVKRKRPVSKLLLDEHQRDSNSEEEMELKQGRGKSERLQSDDSFSEEEDNEKEMEGEAGAVDEQTRRVISHQIAKNKGLLPSRKKEQRNPRVRYRKKYQQKLKRRKGQVREVRRELERYAGEISGIKANVIKSVKFK